MKVEVATLDVESAKNMPLSKIRELYKTYLEEQNLSHSNMQTILCDSFYLWNNVSKDAFWNTVISNDFDNEGKDTLYKALVDNSKGNAVALVSSYMSSLRRFRNFIYSANGNGSVQDDLKALKDFLLDIDCLNPLYEWTSKFNLFDILKITKTEIRHSNVLAWLLNPNENHGFSDSILKGFIQHIVNVYSEDEDVFKLLLMDLHDFIIQREWHNIDILAVSTHSKLVLCIENKIESREHDNQLQRYRKTIEELYPNYSKIFIYLSPDGSEASEPDFWYSMSYLNVLEIIENARRKTKLLPDTQLLIDNYVDTIRRDIVGDEKLAQICAEIYAKHQKALDLIFENRPDRASELASILKAWAIQKTQDGKIQIVEEKCAKSYIRFKTDFMSSLIPDSTDADSGWNTKNHYFYEIYNPNGKEYYIQFVVSGANLTDEQRDICEIINKHFPSRHKKEKWQWRTHYVTGHSKVGEELNEDKIFELLDKKLEEITSFEEKLKSIFNTN